MFGPETFDLMSGLMAVISYGIGCLTELTLYCRGDISEMAKTFPASSAVNPLAIAMPGENTLRARAGCSVSRLELRAVENMLAPLAAEA